MRRRARACALPSRPRGRHAVIEQLQGRLHALGEELIGQVAIGQRPGQLQGADHESEERERVGSRCVGVLRLQAGRDVVGGGELLVGEDLSRGGGAAHDLVEQRG